MLFKTPPVSDTGVNRANTTQREALTVPNIIHRRPVPPGNDTTLNGDIEYGGEATEKHQVWNERSRAAEFTTSQIHNLDNDVNLSDGIATRSVQPYQDGLALEEVRCSLLSHLPAVWSIQTTHIKLSALAATILFKENLLKPSECQLTNVLQQRGADRKSFEPTDPISGILSAAHGTIGGVLMGLADYPIEITRIVKEDKSLGKGMAVNFAIDKGKGVSRIVGTGLRAPMDYTMALSKGFHNLPKFYGDRTVRQLDKVTGAQSGLKVAGKSLGYGLYDGITGLFTQPMEGAKQGGGIGAIKGLGKGIGGLICKPAAGACGLPAYALRGIYEEIHKKTGGYRLMEDMYTAQGLEEWMSTTVEVRDQVIRRWYEMNECPKYSRKV